MASGKMDKDMAEASLLLDSRMAYTHNTKAIGIMTSIKDGDKKSVQMEKSIEVHGIMVSHLVGEKK